MMGVRMATGKALLILVAVFIICAGGGVVVSPAAAEELPLVPAVYVFGDSTMDVGNNMYLGNVTPPFPPLPYGIDFPPGSGPNGRFSNGYNMADSICTSRLLGFNMSPPAYLSLTPETSVEILKGFGGVNYASGGSGILDITGNASLPLSKQVEYFADTKANMTEASGGNSTDVDVLLSKSLFLISDGGNDMFEFFAKNPLDNSNDQPFYDDLVSNYTEYVKRLHELGARRFGVVGVPPIGCVPVLRALIFPFGKTLCLSRANDLAGGFNEKLSVAMAELSASLPGMKYSMGSSYNLVLNFTGSPEAAGFNNVNSACCGGGYLGGQAFCSSPNTTYCDNRDDHLFWDGVHCTQATSNKGAKAIYDAPLVEGGFAAPINFRQLLLDDQPPASAVNLLITSA